MSIERKNPVGDLATDENLELGVETTAAAPEPSPKGDDPSIADMSVGEVLSTFSPNSNRAAERIYEQYNPDQLVQANDPTINGYAVENRTNNYFSYLDDLFDDDAGLTEEEKKQKRIRQAMADALQDSHEEKMERERKEFQTQWDKQTQSFGGREWKGEDLRKFLNWALDNPEELDAVDQQLIAQGVPPSQVKTMRQKFEEAARLKLMQANGQKLTPEQEMLLHKYESDPDVILYSEKAELRREKGLEFANQHSTSSSYQEQAASQTLIYSQLEQNKQDIVKRPESFSLGARLASQPSNNSSLNQTKDKIGNLANLIEQQRSGLLTEEQNSKLKELQQDQSVVAYSQQAKSKTVASFQDDFSDASQETSTNGLQGQFAQAKASVVPLDQEKLTTTPPPSRLAMEQQAVGLNFS